jgi:hypothetical protein
MTAALPRAEPAATAALPRERGFALCKPDPVEKKPTYPRRPTFSRGPAAFRPGDQLGVIGGPLSDGNRPGHATVIIGLDAAEAVAKADEFLPATAMAEGRPFKPRSHRYFLVPFDSIPAWAVSTAAQAAPAALAQRGHPGPLSKSLRHAETNQEVLKFCGTDSQCVCPPSRHDSGECRAGAGGEPGKPAALAFFHRLRGWVQGDFTTTEARTKGKCSKGTTLSRLAELCEAGLVEQVERHHSTKPAVWRLTGADPDNATVLPTAEQLSR